MRSQKEIVYDIVTDYMSIHYPSWSIMSQPVKDILNPVDKRQIIDEIYNILSSPTSIPVRIPLSALRSYCVGLMNNWMRKDIRLNGNTPYRPAGLRPSNGRDILYSPDSPRPESVPRSVVTKELTCECGAIHTSNPTFHSSWCLLSK